MMTILWPLLVMALLLMQPAAGSAGGADASLPSPTRRMIIVHGIPGGSDPASIDADTIALLDEAAQTANGDDSAFILLKPDGAGTDSDVTRMHCQAEAMRAYLIDQGIDLSRVTVDMDDELRLPLMSRSTCESGAPLRHLAN